MSRIRSFVGIGLVAGCLSSLPLWAQTPVRQPYLQLGTPTSMTIVWLTSAASDSRVHYGTVLGSLNQTVNNAAVVTNHVVTIAGLSPATKYFYDVGSAAAVQAGGTSEHYFVTSPTQGSAVPFRIWVVGDSGNGGAEQAAVRDAMLTYTGAIRPDITIHVGDIAYTSGTDQEFTDFHFAIYKDILRHTVQWPTLGNHEGASTTSGSPGASTGPYYNAFVLPTAAEAGGTASGTEAYYSFDYGNIHFISLNSYQVSRSATGPMATWLQNDLASTSAQWVVAYWHHPPYSHGTHNSDSEIELREMRENILPILEAGGVDLVLGGHSHNYERSYLIDGTYSTPTPNFPTLQAQGHILGDGDGKLTGTGAYQKASGLNPHAGTVYVVAGHGGAGLGGTLDHPVMYFSEAVFGSCLIDVNGNTLTLTNVRSTAVVSDTFTIQKGPQTPKVSTTLPTKSAVIGTLPTIRVSFTTGVTGVDAGDLIVNGSIATSLTGVSGGSVYDFGGFAAPGNGHVSVVLAAGGIADAANPGLQFTGNSWSYTIDTTPPKLVSESPLRNTDVGVLPSITVNFTKAVTGVAAGSLLVSGQPAATLSGISGSSGPYTFTGYPVPPTGLVSIALGSGAIVDSLSQPFAGDSWVYVLRPTLVINEFLTSNNTSVQDEFGEFDDYVEIYNPANIAVDMGGLHLSDNLGFPSQFKIPGGVVIPAFGHVVFWCDGQTGQGPRHTNFNLARAGESVGLFDTDTNGFALLDSTSWVNAATDVPQGRFPDGASGFVNMPATAGAANAISCTLNSQCSALADQCNTGVCSANLCVAQPANQGLSCNDGIACRGPDTCNLGLCDGGGSLCTLGELCNLVTGLCEVPVADPLPITAGVPWKYFVGSTAPPATWNQATFDDSVWTTGNSGFGYGPDCIAQQATIPAGLQGSAVSLYVRRQFHIDNPGAVQSMTLTMDYDDGFVAYINGNEVARNNVVGTPPSNTQVATADHECSVPVPSGTNNPPQSFTISLPVAQLVGGNNVLAIQGHNLTAGSSDFTLVPTLAAVVGSGCAISPECDDGNDCTSDACVAGACQNTPDNGLACSDGIACTSDACSNGSCVSASACPVGQTCSLGTGLCQVTPVTVTFQQGAGAPVYSGTVDTFIQAASAVNNSLVSPLTVDGVPPTTDERQILIRFDNIFGNGAGQIPAGATISSATLEVNVSNAMAQVTNFHRMLRTWNPADIWSTYGSTPWNATQGVQADGVEALVLTDAAPASVALSPPLQSISVLTSLQAWSANPASNFGWVLRAAIADSLVFDSSEGTTIANRPKLTVTYTFTPPCSVDADCSDSNVCNGLETCVATVCLPGTALNCADTNVCTTDSCSPTLGCQNVNNTLSCSDGNACTANDTCSGGSCVPGGAANCDDGNVCTSDSCVPATGCAHANVSGACSDGNLCTTADVCAAGTCGGTPVTCPIGQTCNAGTGVCQAGPTTVTFQQGASGYTGSVDTYIDTALGSQATVSPIVIDGSPVEQALLRFDGIFGSGAGQIPSGSTVSSATLTLWVGSNTSDESSDTVSFHRLLHPWNAADVWAAYGLAPWNATGGIQNDDVDAVAATAGTAAMIALATSYPVDVTTSLQAWVASPSSNFGWAILPPAAGTNGLRLESSESTTASNARRPMLSVTFNPPVTGCTINQDCSDNNLCNGLETCVATVCQPGTALNCADTNVCTTDSCSPTLGCQNVNNTASCSDGNACTANDTCSGGSCVAGGATNCDDSNVCTSDSCVPASGCAHANVSGACSDGNLCTTADVCAAGTCGGTPVTCPVGQSCNPTNGLCQAATDPPLPIVVGDSWSYFKGTQEPAPPPAPPTWATVGFVETGWLTGPSGFGYGPDGCMTQVGTTLPDMPSTPTPPGYFSIYARRKFNIVNPAAVSSMTAVVDYDDSVVIYVNGTEVGRSTSMGGTAGTPTAFNTPAPLGHECSVCDTLPCNPAQLFTISPSVLVAGTNVIAIHAHNQSLTSSDFILIPTLSATVTGCTTNADCSDNNLCNGIETCVATVCQPGTALNCADTNVCTTDSCSPTLGCQHANNTIACNDNNACTAGDACGGGACAGTPVGCPVGQSCNPANGLCETSGVMSCSLSSPTVVSNGTVGMNVFLQNQGGLPTIRGYQTQISITRTSGSGTLDVGCPGGVSIDENRLDYIFNGQPNRFPATNCPLKRASSSLLSGSVTVGPPLEYLSSYTLTPNGAAVLSTFDIAISASPDSALANQSGQPVVFTVSPPCTLTISGGCSTNAECSDGNPCTDDVCNATACVHTNNAVSCNDASACTTNDTCSGGACVGGPAPNCDDTNVCTTDSCSPALGCQHANNANACNDNNACTTSDACSGGSCAGTAINCSDASICTTDACNPSSGCTHAVSGLCSIGGSVLYYRDNAAGGSEPSLKVVPNVDIDSNQDGTAEATTDSGGVYGLGSQGGTVVVEPLDKFGTPRASDHNDAITSFDATVIAQYVVSSITLSNNQKIAGDVTGNGTVSSLDASQVAQFAVQLIDHFGVTTLTGSDWSFLRCDIYTSATTQTCATPSYSHAPLAQSETDNFYAVLYGDVTGNWAPLAPLPFGASGGRGTSAEELAAGDLDRQQASALRAAVVSPAVRSESAGPARLSLSGWSAPLAKGQQREVLVRVDQADGIQAMDLTLRYDMRRLSVVGIRAVGMGAQFNVVSRDETDSTKLAAYGVLALRGSGTVLAITVEARTDIGSKNPLKIGGQANEGMIPLVVGNRAINPIPRVKPPEVPDRSVE